jgi:hypothetical protein
MIYYIVLLILSILRFGLAWSASATFSAPSFPISLLAIILCMRILLIINCVRVAIVLSASATTFAPSSPKPMKPITILEYIFTYIELVHQFMSF